MTVSLMNPENKPALMTDVFSAPHLSASGLRSTMSLSLSPPPRRQNVGYIRMKDGVGGIS